MITTTRGTKHVDIFPYGEPSYLLTVDHNTKMNKSLKKLNVLTAIMHLSPATQSVPYGGANMCPWATAGCAAACLTSSGRMKFDGAEIARLKRTLWFMRDRPSFLARLIREIRTFRGRARIRGHDFAVRLNGTSDIAWERTAPEIFAAFPDVQFYDYTKGHDRMYGFIGRTHRSWPKNYHLTYSLSEREGDQERALNFLGFGGNVAAVFRSPDLIPKWYKGFKTVPADDHDCTFRWPPGTWLALKAKGDALKDTSGFVLDVEGQDAAELPDMFAKTK